MTLAPVVPLGAHAALGPVSQDKVVATVRASEVAADPTNALALEAAVRRAGEHGALVRLAAFQRVVRAQQSQPGYLPHFSLLGLVTAGRDTGGHRFHRESVAEHVLALAGGLAAAGFAPSQLALTPLSAAGQAVAAALPGALASADVEVIIDAGRQAGRRYYRDLCFKLNIKAGGNWAEIADGGFTDWVARLTASRKERLLISGLGVELLAAMMPR